MNKHILPSDSIKYLARKENLSKLDIASLKFWSLFGLTNMYWNQNLKSNNAYKQRFDAPYDMKATEVTTRAYLSNIK